MAQKTLKFKISDPAEGVMEALHKATHFGVSARGGGKDRSGKDPLEYFPTPALVTQALLAHWRPRAWAVWEPACGTGDMAKVLMAEGLGVIASDIVDRGYKGQQSTADFLQTKTAAARAVITNPPFSRALAFMQHGIDLGIEEMAFLTKVEFWVVGKNARFFDRHPPALVMPIVGRVDFNKGGNPVMCFQWNVWDARHQGPTRFLPIRRIQQKELKL